MRTFRIIYIILFLLTFSLGAKAQSHEVPTGPFRDSTNYIPPPPLKIIKVKSPPHHIKNNQTKKIIKDTCSNKCSNKESLNIKKP